MAAGFFAVFDDIAALLDDAAAMSKIATKKTAGVLGDDLAVGAQKASGFASSRELPVLWAITKGSFRNKMIILPIAFLLSAFLPWSIVPILMLGGLYLAFEGAEKIYEYFLPHANSVKVQPALTKEEILTLEAKKIKSAIMTDFILSIEIVIIALGTVVEKALPIQVIVVTAVALLATVGVYGFVALLVRMDDMGFALIKVADNRNKLLKSMGEILVIALPKVIKFLSVIGTLAMLLVAGGIFLHNVQQIHDLLHLMPSLLAELATGLVVGVFVMIGKKVVMKIKNGSCCSAPQLNFNRIKMAFYAIFLTNLYGLKLKKAALGVEKKRLRLEYAQKLLSALKIDVVLKKSEKLPKDNRFLLISNHRSIIDPLVIEIALKDTDIFGLWISKKELYNSFFFGAFTRNGGSILLDRESKQMGTFFKEIKSNVSEGNAIFLFPEGTRNKEESVLSEFKDGARIIAMKNRLPILPVYIRTNANDVLESALENSAQQQQIIVEIGELIDYKDRSVELEAAYKSSFDLK